MHDRQEAVKPMPRSRASPATRSRQTWPARAGLPSLTSKPPSAANLCRKSPGAPVPALSPSSSLTGRRQWGTCPALPSTLSSGSSSRDSTPGNTEDSQQSRVHPLRLRLHHQGLPLHQHKTTWPCSKERSRFIVSFIFNFAEEHTISTYSKQII